MEEDSSNNRSGQDNIGHLFMKKIRLRDCPKTMVVLCIVIVIVAIYLLAFVWDRNFNPNFNYLTPAGKHTWRWNESTLPNFIIPTSYFIESFSNIEMKNLISTVTINVTLLNSTKGIVMHSKRLKITNATYRYISNGNLTHVDTEYINYDRELNYVYFIFPTMLPVGNGSIKITYTTSLSRTSSIISLLFRNCQGKIETSQSFQFGKNRARTLLPCFDEPQIKSEFQISVMFHYNYTAILSNTERQSTHYFNNGSYILTFQKSPKMSIRNLALYIGNLTEYSPKQNNTNPRISIWTSNCETKNSHYAYHMAREAIIWLSNYTNTPYLIEKLDIIEFQDYLDVADNWGIIFSESSSLILDDFKYPTYLSKELVATKIVYKIAHLWFGNLVSPKDESQRWVSNGITSVLTYLFFSENYDEIAFEKLFLIKDRSIALQEDEYLSSNELGLNDTFPKLKSPATSKGAMIILNILKSIGERNFCLALRCFIEKYALSSVTGYQLLEVFSNYSDGLAIKEYFYNWIKFPGYPLLEFRKEKGILFANQKRYVIGNNKDNTTTRWWIHFSLKTSNRQSEPEWTNEKSFEVDTIYIETWYKANIDSTGFYRVNYPIENWRALSTEMSKKNSLMSDEDKIGFLSDLFSLAESGLVDYMSLFTILNRILPNEKSVYVWREIINQLDRLDLLISNLHCHGYYRDFVKRNIKYRLDELSWSPSNYSDYEVNHMKSYLFNFAIRLNDNSFVLPAFDLWKEYINETDSKEPDLHVKNAVFMAISEFGSHLDWNEMLKRFNNATNAHERRSLLNGLAFTKRPSLLKYLLNLSLNPKMIDPQFRTSLYQKVSTNLNVQGLIILWEFIKNNWSELKIQFSPEMPVILNMFSRFASISRLEDFKNFLKPFVYNYESSFNLTIEKIQHNINWINDNGETVCTILYDMHDNLDSNENENSSNL